MAKATTHGTRTYSQLTVRQGSPVFLTEGETTCPQAWEPSGEILQDIEINISFRAGLLRGQNEHLVNVRGAVSSLHG
jgi:hypothetical protein